MAKYIIEFTSEAKIDLSYFNAFERKIILNNINNQLTSEPTKETRNRKKLRENPFSNWALRIGKYRVFYHVMEDIMTISIVAVGFKEHNNLYIRGKKVKI